MSKDSAAPALGLLVSGTLRPGRGSYMPTALITIPYFITRDPSPREKLEAAGWTVRDVPDGMRADEDRLIGLLDGVDATVAGGEPYAGRVIATGSSLKHIARWGVGFHRGDLAAA